MEMVHESFLFLMRSRDRPAKCISIQNAAGVLTGAAVVRNMPKERLPPAYAVRNGEDTVGAGKGRAMHRKKEKSID